MDGVKQRRRRLSEQAWREVMQRFDAGSETVSDFCEREGLGVSSFHRWRPRVTAASSNALAPAGRAGAAPASRRQRMRVKPSLSA